MAIKGIERNPMLLSYKRKKQRTMGGKKKIRIGRPGLDLPPMRYDEEWIKDDGGTEMVEKLLGNNIRK